MLIRKALAMGLFKRLDLAAAIRALFASGEQGAWFDPSDWATLFTDSAGTTPVTAVGQPVGLMLDKRLGLVRGVEQWAAASTGTPGGYGNVVTASSSGFTSTNNSTFSARAYLNLVTVAGTPYEVQCTNDTNTSSVAPYNASNGGGSALQAVVSGSGAKRLVFTATGTASSILWISNAGVGFSVSAISVRELPGNHASQATAANRPVLQVDGAGKYYLAFNGTNSSMATAAIDFTGTDKMTVWGGISVVEPAAQVLVLEHGTSFANAGAFAVTRNVGIYGIYGRSTAGSTALAGKTRTFGTGGAVIAGQIDYAASAGSEFSLGVSKQAANGATGATEENTGTLGNLPLYIGARQGSSGFLQGSIYSLIIRGAASSASQISAGENYINSKTGAY